jgi:hypothetical protein
MPIDLKVGADGWDTTIVIENNSSKESYDLALPRKPTRIRLDPDSWLLADIFSINDATLPTALHLYQNYPNPFNPSSTIEFDLPRRTHVVLVIYNILGEEMARLADGTMEPGHHAFVWDGTSAGRPVPSGAYICRITAESAQQSIRIMKLE